MARTGTRLLGLLGAGLVALVMVAGCGSTGAGPSSSSASGTTPLGCAAGLPPTPLQASEAQLECTERALISRVCDLNSEVMSQGGPAGTTDVRQVRYSDSDPFDVASFTYYGGDLTSNGPVTMACSIPGGGLATKVGNVQLNQGDWTMVVSPGSVLPAKLQPQNLASPRYRSRPTAVPKYPTPPSTGSSNRESSDCDGRAVDVFTRYANGQITLAQAREQLPAGVPLSSLTSGLAGVKRYESDGLSHDAAVTEVGGAVGQACPR